MESAAVVSLQLSFFHESLQIPSFAFIPAGDHWSRSAFPRRFRKMALLAGRTGKSHWAGTPVLLSLSFIPDPWGGLDRHQFFRASTFRHGFPDYLGIGRAKAEGLWFFA